MNMFRFLKKKTPASRPETAATAVRTNPAWLTALLNLAVVLLLAAVIIEVYRWADRRAKPLVKKQTERIDVRAQLKNVPTWLDPRITAQILAHTNAFQRRDQATADRFQDPLDQEILRDIAANYTGTDSDGINHWSLHENAWIKKITEVRRVISADRKSQIIEISAEYRFPAAWVEYENNYYLVDADLVRLPDTFSAADRKHTPALMQLTGVQLPPGNKAVPQPSEQWNTEDVAAGLALINLLSKQPYVGQIASIDLGNFRGRKDPLKSWITLNTIFNVQPDAEAVAANMPALPGPVVPRTVLWGRPVGEEKYYEIAAATKVRTLNDIYMRFGRIDANHDFVDIRTEQVWLPKLAVQN